MKVYIFLHGKLSEGKFYRMHYDLTRRENDIVICANGGYKTAISLDIEPQIVVGDLDSLQETEIDPGITVLQYPPQKDHSDFELALMEAVKLKPEKVFVYGALGGRKDHEIINVNLLAHAAVPIVFLEEEVEIYNVIRELEITEKKGRICSLVTFGESCHVEASEGFRYPLNDEILLPSSRGLSNVIDGDKACIRVKHGELLVIVTSHSEG